MEDKKFTDESAERVIKVVETQMVTEEVLEIILNEWVINRGYVLEGIHFAMRESSKRPAMAFLIFYKKDYGKGV